MTSDLRLNPKKSVKFVLNTHLFKKLLGYFSLKPWVGAFVPSISPMTWWCTIVIEDDLYSKLHDATWSTSGLWSQGPRGEAGRSLRERLWGLCPRSLSLKIANEGRRYLTSLGGKLHEGRGSRAIWSTKPSRALRPEMVLDQIAREPSPECNFPPEWVWYHLPKFAIDHRPRVGQITEFNLRFIKDLFIFWVWKGMV